MLTILTRPTLALSPMANFSDSPYRELCRRFGASFSFTEFLSTDAICRRDPKVLDLLRFQERERPIVFQIFGSNPDKLLYAAQFIEELEPDGIDLNMGCSVRHVAHKGSGAGMLRDPVRTGRIVERLVCHLKVPLSAKIRLGWSEQERNYLEVARILEESGIAFLSVHGRTKRQGYKGRADWDAIGEIQARVSIPVLGNGDLRSRTEALFKIRQYGLAGALLGRAAIGRPWIFQEGKSGVRSPAEIQKAMRLHWKLFCRHHSAVPPERRLLLFRKHLSSYLAEAGVPDFVRRQMLVLDNPEMFERISLDFLSHSGETLRKAG